jgi:S-adenosylmethionine-diacylgycerolhomoserine-N-methlytransferase
MLCTDAPHHTLYGLDASLSMLATAREKLDSAGCTERITLGHGLAQELAPQEQLRTEGPFDVIFFSYVLSMIPSWPRALRAALAHLAPGGHLFVVDFWDQANLPSWVATALQRWLALFDVYPRPALMDTFRTLDEVDGLSCTLTPVARRYAYRVNLHAPAAVPTAALDLLDGAGPESKRFDSSEIIAA